MPMEDEAPLEILIHTLGLPIRGDDPVDLSLGGSESAVLSMAHALSRLGHRVSVSCRTEERRESGGIELIPAERLVEHRKGTRCDLFLAAREVPSLLEPVAARMYGTWHHDAANEERVRLIRPGFARASFCLFLSRFQQEGYEAFLPGLSRLAHLTTNGVDFGALEPIRKKAAALGGSRPRFFYASRPERGLDVLLGEIWPVLKSRLPEAELLVSSYSMEDLPLHDRHRETIRRCDELIRRSPDVHPIGPLTRRAFWRELADCTAVLYPTDVPEVCCMVALEAQALGIPIVTTGRFGLRETVGFHETLVSDPWQSPAYVGSFVAAVLRLVEDPSFAERARDTGLRHVTPETHSWDAIAKRWQSLFHRLFREGFERRKPTISAALLVKNEEANVRRAVASLETIADEIVIGDTGSSDRTVEVLESMGFRRGEGGPGHGRRRWVPIPFEDFAQARNALARHAHGDYILWQDADEVLFNAQALRDILEFNEYFDGFAIEQRNLSLDANLESSYPVRCYRPETEDGPLQWFGCLHESVEHRLNEPPRRIMICPDVYLDHLGILTSRVRQEKALARNWPLFLKDRRENPDRWAGYVIGMEQYLLLARWEISTAGTMTKKACQCLNYAFEIWHAHVRHLPKPYREVGSTLSREILALLTAHGAPLRLRGGEPFQAGIEGAPELRNWTIPPELFGLEPYE
ncbi:MAG: glycogen synthase [Acidobacteriota bacterium]|nr:glycogen synthase [Acidobacteriota bacterium]